MRPNNPYEAIFDLQVDYCRSLDSDRLEEWPEYFVDDCLYEIQSRENVALGLPAPLIRCHSKGMLLDRVIAIREALTYEFRFLRHYVTNSRIHENDDGSYSVDSNFLVLSSDEEGVTTIFAAGQYLDEVVFRNGRPLFRKKIAITDTFGIDNLLAIPL